MSARDIILNITLGYQASQAVFAAANIGIFEERHPFDHKSFSQSKGLIEDGIKRLLVFLERMGFVQHIEDGQYIVDPDIQQVLIDEGVINFLKHQSLCWEDWTQLEATLRGGQTRKSQQSWLVNDSVRAKLFAHALHSVSYPTAKNMIVGLKENWKVQPKQILDVGGGLGSFAYACKETWPDCYIAIMEQGGVAKAAREYGDAQIIEGDVRKETAWTREWDLIIMGQVLSNLCVADREKVLSLAQNHLAKSGAILISDFFDDTKALGSARFGLHMWVVSETGGSLNLGWLEHFCAETRFHFKQIGSLKDPLSILLKCE